MLGFSSGANGKESTCSAGDSGSVPGLGRSPGEGNGNPPQYSYLENSMNRGAWHAESNYIQWARSTPKSTFETSVIPNFHCIQIIDKLSRHRLYTLHTHTKKLKDGSQT